MLHRCVEILLKEVESVLPLINKIMNVQSCVIVLIGCSLGEGASREQMTIHNKHFKIGAVPRPPVAIISKDRNGKDIIGGLLGAFFEYLKDARNITYKVVIPDDGRWGNCYGNNNCTGMIGLVNRNEVDFAIGNIMTLSTQ